MRPPGGDLVRILERPAGSLHPALRRTRDLPGPPGGDTLIADIPEGPHELSRRSKRNAAARAGTPVPRPRVPAPSGLALQRDGVGALRRRDGLAGRGAGRARAGRRPTRRPARATDRPQARDHRPPGARRRQFGCALSPRRDLLRRVSPRDRAAVGSGLRRPGAIPRRPARNPAATRAGPIRLSSDSRQILEVTLMAEPRNPNDAMTSLPVETAPHESRPSGPREAPVLPLRQTVLFPFALLPFTVGREKSVKLLQDVMAGDRTLALIMQRDGAEDDPAPEGLYEIGTLATVTRMVRVAENRYTVLVQGGARVRRIETLTTDPYLKVRIEPLGETEPNDIETEARVKTLHSQFERIVALSPTIPDEAVATAKSQPGPGRLADFIASLLDLQASDKQKLLELLDVKKRLEALTEMLERELQVLEVGQQIQESVRESVEQNQKEFLLRQQMEAIRKELGETDETQHEIDELKQKIEQSGMPPEVRKEADRELARLTRIPPQAAEYTVSRTYLEWLCDMPWSATTDDDLDFIHVRQVLDEDHFGLDKIKERILEFLVARRFKKDARTPILCFVGPPGTGKTSLGRSNARALGRKFVRQSLGGVRDEAEIRGHRRTYIGSLPGNIIRGIRRAGSRNPLFMLDEIDKLGADFRGDPASALLEVLDPEQNATFMDHYLDVPFDLSQVLFVTTANMLDTVPPPLRDRMEVIELAGYTENEKLSIARRHLIPKAERENGLESLGIVLEDDAVLKVIREYTREAGLRNLERQLATLLRKAAKLIAEGKETAITIDAERVRVMLGPERFEHERASKLDQPGAALGLAWTPAGGELQAVAATVMPGD